MSLLVTGSVAIDTVTSPHGQVVDVLGGSAVYFAFAAVQYVPVRLVAVVGDDLPPDFRTVLASRDIDLSGLEVRRGGKTFRWRGRYTGDMHEAETVQVDLNVLAHACPTVPTAFAGSKTVFLANTARQMGAVAASAQGAGFGGSVWALVAESQVDEFMHRWASNYREAFPARADNADFFATASGPPATSLDDETFLS